MLEYNTIRLVEAFIISRITYVASYLKWQVTERTKLDCIIRKAYKRAIGLPSTGSEYGRTSQTGVAQHLKRVNRSAQRRAVWAAGKEPHRPTHPRNSWHHISHAARRRGCDIQTDSRAHRRSAFAQKHAPDASRWPAEQARERS